jgi:hypothetical protein
MNYTNQPEVIAALDKLHDSGHDGYYSDLAELEAWDALSREQQLKEMGRTE